MRRRVAETRTEPEAGGEAVVCVCEGHRYNGREGRVLGQGTVPAQWTRVEFPDGYIGLFRADGIAKPAAGGAA